MPGMARRIIGDCDLRIGEPLVYQSVNLIGAGHGVVSFRNKKNRKQIYKMVLCRRHDILFLPRLVKND